jgi:cation:H+ antiporter
MGIIQNFDNFIYYFSTEYPQIIMLIVLAASLYILIKSTDYILYGIVNWAKKLGLSDYLIGLFVVALAAALPEFVAGINSSIQGESDMIMGTFFGTNIISLTLLLGVMALLTKKLNIKSKLFNNVKLLVLLMVILPILLALDGTLSRIDGIILIITYFIYFSYLWYQEGKLGQIKKNVKFEKIWQHGLIFLLALGALLLSARWMVYSSLELANIYNIPPFLVALVVIGICTQIPDLLTIIKSILKGHKNIGIGDILGSVIIKSLLFLGILAVYKPIITPLKINWVNYLFTILGISFFLFSMRKGYLTRNEGIGLIGSYFIFMILSILIF